MYILRFDEWKVYGVLESFAPKFLSQNVAFSLGPKSKMIRKYKRIKASVTAGDISTDSRIFFAPSIGPGKSCQE